MSMSSPGFHAAFVRRRQLLRGRPMDGKILQKGQCTLLSAALFYMPPTSARKRRRKQCNCLGFLPRRPKGREYSLPGCGQLCLLLHLSARVYLQPYIAPRISMDVVLYKDDDHRLLLQWTAWPEENGKSREIKQETATHPAEQYCVARIWLAVGCHGVWIGALLQTAVIHVMA